MVAAVGWLSILLPVGAQAALDQGPISRVLRQNDVPKGQNVYLPTGVLSAGEFVSLLGGSKVALHSFVATLKHDHFQSGAVVEFNGPGTRALLSFAAEFPDSGGARAGLRWAADLVRGSHPLTSATDVLNVSGTNPVTIVMAPASDRAQARTELMQRGSFVYGLSCADTDEAVCVHYLPTLMRRVLSYNR